LIRDYVIEIERLKGDLTAARQKNGVFLTQESYNDLSEESESRRILNEEYERRIEILETQVKNTREQFEHNMKMFMDVKKELEITNHTLDDTRNTLAERETDLSTTKQNLDDETVLRKAHEKTEKELDRIGMGLITTTRQTVSDVNGLHAKIRRMTDLEVVNHTTWSKSTNHVADITQHVEREIDIFTDEQHKVTDAVSQRITAFVEAQNKKLEEAYAFIESRFGDFKTKESELSGETVKSKDEMNNVLEEIKTLREDIKNRVGEGLKGLNDNAQRIAADVIEDLSRFGTEV
jgi:kinesin family protein 11